MLSWLAKRFIRDWDRTDRTEVRMAWGQLAGVVSILCNTALSAAKIAVGAAAGSVAVIADGVNNLSDAASNVISFLGFRLAARPADAEHPYGHGRYEYLAGLMVAVLILAAGLELLESSIRRVLAPERPAVSWVMAAVLAGSVLVKLWMMHFNRSAGGRIGSETLLAAAADSRNDAVATAVVLAGMAVSHVTGLALDGWLGVGVALFVLYSGFTLVRDTADPLVGRMPAPEVIEDIRRRIEACPGVLATHDLMLHDYGPGRRYASAHVEVSAEDDIMALHRALDALIREFLERDGLHIVFQLDPITRDDTEENRLRRYMASRMSVIDERLTIHDLAVGRAGETVTVRFDCFVPADVAIPESQLRRMLENIVRERYPRVTCQITIDRGYMAPPHEEN